MEEKIKWIPKITLVILGTGLLLLLATSYVILGSVITAASIICFLIWIYSLKDHSGKKKKFKQIDYTIDSKETIDGDFEIVQN